MPMDLFKKNKKLDNQKRNPSKPFFRNTSLALLDRGIDKLETFLPAEKVTTALVMSPSYLQSFIAKNYSHVFNASNIFIHHPENIVTNAKTCYTGHFGNTYQHHFVSQYHSLPFGSKALDLVFMPFMLNIFSKDQRQLMFAELSQCLADDATLLVMGMNKQSLLGYQLLRHKNANSDKAYRNEIPRHLISIKNIQHELEAFNLTLVGSRYFDYAPSIANDYFSNRSTNPCSIAKEKRYAASSWFNNAGDRWWPTMANGYVLMFKPVADFARLNRASFTFKKTKLGYNPKQVPSYYSGKD